MVPRPLRTLANSKLPWFEPCTTLHEPTGRLSGRGVLFFENRPTLPSASLGSLLARLPNGSRLSCGRLARRRKGVGRSPCPARAQHSASLRTISDRQLQALVRQPGLQNGTQPSPPHSHTTLSGTEARLPEPMQEGQTRAPASRTGARPEMPGKRLLPAARAA